jgi:hypothetical protein
MNRAARPLILLAIAAVLSVGIAACGGSDEQATSSTNVNQLLRDTFSGDKHVDSGHVDLRLKLAAQGGAAAGRLGGPVTVRLTGPFESQGEGRLPDFALDAQVESGGRRIDAGATATGEAGYVSFQGTDYAVSDQVYQQFKAGYEEAQKRGKASSGRSFASLGMDPRRWLKRARNAGEAKVGDTETIKITGQVDVPALLDDIDAALEKARSLGLQNAGRLPNGLTPAQRRAAARAVKSIGVALYTGKDDHILRRIVLDMRVAERGKGSGTLALDLALTGVNEDQDIAAPSDPRPFGELVGKLRGLGLALGGAGRAGAGAGGTGGDRIERYSRCITRAGNDATAARKCADLLTP